MSTSEYPAQRIGNPRLPRLRALVAARPIPADVWIVGALVVVAAVIRIVTIDNQSFWMDEALTAYEAQLPFGAMVNTVVHVETTPPLYFVLTWVWAHLFGAGEVALRSISTLAGIALVPITYLSARELVSRWAGVVAAAFVAVNPYLTWYSQEARAYMLLATLTGASFLWFNRARRDPGRRNLAWWAVCSALAVMTHFFAGFLIIPEALWLLWIARTRVAAVAVAAVAATQVAMAPLAFIDTSHGVNWILGASKITRLGLLPLDWGVSTLERKSTPTVGLVAGAVLILVTGLLLAFGGDRQTRRGAKPGIVLTSFVILVPLALGFVGQDYFLSRNVLPAFLPLITVLAAACVAPRARVLGATLGLALITMFVVATAEVQSHRYLQRPQWRHLAHVIGAATVPRAILAASGSPANPLKIYLPRVSWVEPHTRKLLIAEVDVVGARFRQPIVSATALAAEAPHRRVTGVAMPRRVAPPGSRLLSRVTVNNWVFARFELRHPIKVDIVQLTRLAPRFFAFGHAPIGLLVFTQRVGN